MHVIEILGTFYFTGRLDDSRNSINLTRMSDSPDRNVSLSLSDSSLNGGPGHKTNGFGRSW